MACESNHYVIEENVISDRINQIRTGYYIKMFLWESSQEAATSFVFLQKTLYRDK